MTTYFVDTSAWYELLDGSAPRHVEVARAMVGGGPLVTTSYVLHELVALLVARSHRGAAESAGEHIRSSHSVRLLYPNPEDEHRAWRLFKERPDKTYSLTDCLSFVVMRRLRLTTAITTDAHFSQEGFRILP